ncbi:DUF2569 domain-containing protein [Pseudalkalibacillus berkeleyi]|uniref:DUF2569 domain-containing protein n=1 Tax=Pseudalkalibacillus berkeleyi TaxID=1069813 RepID=A0ABS9H1Q8_9BACL|nr:DUF2569 domain-containing protein [Pseudalkalibacillus berkeleyi]MCF6138864.1 DUF2569 domain-containing protein [Pseudalkalibacillus berkeleyi]
MGSKHEGIGGWLILMAVGLMMVPLIRLYSLYQSYWTVYHTPAWSSLTESGNPLYHAWFQPTFWLNIAVDIGFIGLSVAALWLLFTKHSLFPKFMIYYLVGLTVFAIIDGLITNWIFGSLPLTAETLDYVKNQSYRQQAGSLLLCLIWIPYLLRSQRVKTTFVNSPKKQTVADNNLTF